jgi:hypothetical protein
MKTKISIALFAFILSGSMVMAQNVPVQDVKSLPVTKTELQKDTASYVCPMHAEMKMDKPGKCPQCGKTLEKTTMKMGEPTMNKGDAVKTYTCTMHPEVVSDKPGKCPKCSMDLVVKK